MAKINLPEGVDEEQVAKALDLLSKTKERQAKQKERQSNDPAFKAKQAERNKRRQAINQLKIGYANSNGYDPSDSEVDDYLARKVG